TTTIVLAPLALIPGMGGFLFKPLATAVAFAMLASFLLSRTFVPMMCGKFLPEETFSPHADATEPGGIANVIEKLQQRLNRLYERVLEAALEHRGIVLGVVGLLFVCSLGLSFGIGREFFPQVDAGQITIYLRAPSNLRLDAAEKRVAEFETFLRKHIPPEERTMIVSELGLDPDLSSADTANSGQHDAVIRVQLTEARRYTAQEYASRLRRAFAQDGRFADLRVSFDTGGMVQTALNLGQSAPIDIQIDGGTR